VKATLKFKIQRLQVKGKARRAYGRNVRNAERVFAELNRVFDAEFASMDPYQLLALSA
jgi:hypothetical protein